MQGKREANATGIRATEHTSAIRIGLDAAAADNPAALRHSATCDKLAARATMAPSFIFDRRGFMQ
jgi:hypothetical protein